MNHSIAIIGCGNMGRTYARSFLKYGVCGPENLLLVERDETRSAELAAEGLGRAVHRIGPEVAECEIVVLAVKPQDFDDMAAALRPVLTKKNIVLSIMAGISIARIRAALNHRIVVRAMPNLPARIGMGMTGFTADEEVDRAHVRTAEALLNTTGRSIFIEDENLIDAVTAISGSGPAYFFYFVLEMVHAARSMGIGEPTARLLVKQTMLGSYHMLNNARRSPAELIASVSSKGGTTEAAFEVFDRRELGGILREGILRAQERARELAG